MAHYIGPCCFHLHIDLLTRPFLDFVAQHMLKQLAAEDSNITARCICKNRLGCLRRLHRVALCEPLPLIAVHCKVVTFRPLDDVRRK
jgi:hypothetical protein